MRPATYFPILWARQGELSAIARLSPRARSVTRPMLDIPPRKDSASLDTYLCSISEQVGKGWGKGRPLYFDLSRFAPDILCADGRHAVELLFDCARQMRLEALPVSGPLAVRGPGTSYLDAVRGILHADGRGAAVRIPYDDFKDADSLEATVEASLQAIALSPDNVDLFLDAGPLEVLPEIDRSAKWLGLAYKNAIDRIEALSFRSIVIAASVIPGTYPKSL